MWGWVKQEEGMEMPPKPEKKFCKRCGSALERKDILAGYDEYTGERIIASTMMVCPYQDTFSHTLRYS